MGTTLQTQTTRNYLWDNMKTFLIFTVVIGHFFETFPLDSDIASAFDYWIYTFHMPAFLFVSGYWAKSYCRDSRVRAEKIGYFIGYYAIFQILFFLFLVLIDPETNRKFTFWQPNIGLWYLFSMIVYYLIIPLPEKLPSYISLPVFAVLGLLIGTEKDAGTFMAISRTFVFAPFFFLGYYTQESFIEKLRNLKLRVVLGIVLSVVPVAIWASIIYFKSRTFFPMKLFYGKHNFEYMGFDTFEGIGLRLIAWSIGLMMTFSLILLTTKKKNPLTYIGQRSLQIYLFHFFLIMVFKKTSIPQNFLIDSVIDCGLLTLAAVAFTFILSIKPFSYPFNWIKMLVDKIFCISLKKKED